MSNNLTFQVCESKVSGFSTGLKVLKDIFPVNEYYSKIRTDIQVYFENPSESYVKAISITDERGKTYNTP